MDTEAYTAMHIIVCIYNSLTITMTSWQTSPSGQLRYRPNIQLWCGKVPSICIRSSFLECSDTGHLQCCLLTVAPVGNDGRGAALTKASGPCNVCCMLQERASSVDAQRASTKDNLWYDVPQQCHQRSRSISSALVSGSHSLSCVSASERNTADVQYRPSNLFILWRARALYSKNNFLVGLLERNTNWIQIGMCAQLTGRDNSHDDNDEDDDKWEDDSALKLRLLLVSSVTVRLTTLVGDLWRNLQSIHQILDIVGDESQPQNHSK